MVLESNTLDVLFVKDGQQGEDGKVLYTWIKYAKDANGTGMTDDPNGAVYIGISYNNESSTESNDPTQYAWTKIQGADGKKGEDAYTIFLENENISFATDKNRNPLSEQAYTSGITIMKGAKPVTDFTIGDIAKTQGIAVAKTNTAITISVVNGNPLPNDSGEIEIPITVAGTVFKKILTWTCAKKGDQGEKGERGLQGIQGPQGIQGVAGKDGTNGKTTYFHIKYSSVANPTSSFQLTETPSTYIGTYVDFAETDSTDPKKYTWSQFIGSQGPKGEQGIAGVGVDGKTSYLHIAYANSADGKTGFSVSDSTNKSYIGQYTDFTPNDSTDYTKYSWSLIRGKDGIDGVSPTVSVTKNGTTTTITITDKNGTHTQTVKDGTDGTPGAAGKDGKTSYFHVKYSNDGGKTFTGNSGEDTGIYMGSYTDYTEADSTDVKKYNWVKVKGDKGDTGQKGQDGTSVTITSKSVTYQASTSGTTAPTGTWSTSVPTVNNGQYLWTKTTVQYSDGNKTEAYSVSYKGTNGTNGTSVTVSKTEVTYQVSTSGTTAPTGTWSTTMPSCDQGQYLWTKTYVKYSDGKDTTSYSVSYKGVDGEKFAFNMLRETNQGSKHWVNMGASGKYSVESITTEDSINAVKLICTEPIASNEWQFCDFSDYEMLKSLKASTTYTLSYDIKTNRSGKILHNIKTGGGQKMFFANDIACKVLGNETWEHVSLKMTSGTTLPNLDGQVIYMFGDALSKVGYSIIKNLKLTEGIIDTPWAPHPEDLEGRGVSETVQYYLATSQASGVTSSTSGWSTDITTQKLTADKKYLWNCYQTKYSDGTSEPISTPKVIGVYGDKGQKGDSGEDGQDGAGFHWNLLSGTKDFDKTKMSIAGATSFDSQKYLGLTVIKAVSPTSGYIDPVAWNSTITPTPNTQYTISFYAKASVKTLVNSYFYPNCTIKCISNHQTTTAPDGAVSTMLSTEWERYSVTWTTSGSVSGTKSIIPVRLQHGISVDGATVYLCGVKLEQSDKPSPWCTTYEETLAKNLSVTPSSQYFKSTDGGKTFAPNAITIKPTIQGEINFGKWQYSIDGGVSFADVVNGQKGLTISNNVLTVSKDSSLYSDAVTMVTFRAVANNSSFYDTCSVAKIYDVSDIGDGRNLWITRDNITLQACEKDKYIYTTTGTSAVCIGADAVSVGTNTIALQTGTKYTISFVISSPSEVGNALWYFCTALNSTGVKNYGGYGVKLVTGENIVSQTITVDTSCDAAGLVLYHLPTGCVIKDIQVEKGSSPTGWTPAPEDVQTAILSTKSEISDVSLKVDNNKQAIEQRVEKTTYQQDLKLVKGDISKANEGLNKWRYEIYPKSLFTSEYQGKSTMDVFAKNTNLTPSQSVLINDTDFGKNWAYGDNYIGYALTFVKFSAAKSVAITFKHDDGAHLYLNGKLIGGDDTCNTGSGESLTLSFIQGWNCLEVVLNEKSGGEYIGLGTTISAISECQLMNCYYGTPVARQSHITNQLVQNTTDIDGVSGSVQKVMSTVGDSGKIDEFVSNYATWKKKVDGIETRVGETYTTKDDFDDLQIGGRNLLKHSSMIGEKLICDNYFICNNCNIQEYTNDGFHIITPTEGNANNGIAFAFDNFTIMEINGGDTITFSCDIKGTSDSHAPFVSIHISDNNWYGSGVVQKNTSVSITKDWQRVSVTITTPTGLTKNHMWLAIHGNHQSDLYVRNFKLEKGNKPTDWTPAPEDVNGKIVNAETIANQTANKFSWIVKSGTSASNFEITDKFMNLVSTNINLDGIVSFMNTAKGDGRKNLYNLDYSSFENVASQEDAICYAKDNGVTSVGIDSSVSYDGDKSLKISYTTANLNSSTTPLYLGSSTNNYGCVKIQAGKQYILSCYVKSDSTTGMFMIDIQGHDTPDTKTNGLYLSNIDPRKLPGSSTGVNLSTDWQRAVCAIKVADNATGLYWSVVPLIWGKPSSSNVPQTFNVWVDCIMLEEVDSISNEPGTYILDKETIIDGGSVKADTITGNQILAGSITADKIATDAIKSHNYISSGGTQGSFLNLGDGSFTSPNLSWDSNGNLIAKNANLSGEITATNGSIAGWTIISNKMYTTGSGKYTGIGKYGSAYAFWAGATSNDNGNSAVFKVGHTGKLTATDADITGTITATNGKIGRYDITSTYLMTNSGSNASGIGGNQAFWAGAEDSNSAPFRVGYDGVLWAENAAIRGSIETGNLGDEGDTVSIINGHIGIQGTSNNVEIYSTGFKFGIDGDYYLMSVSEGVKCYRNLYATDFVADGWLYCSEVHSSGAVVIGADSESFYWAHGYQIARGTSWGGVCVGDDSQQLRLYGSSIWASHSISTSDENLKENFTTLDQYENFYMNLNPIGFNYIGDYDGKKTHFGFGAHKTEDVLESEGYDADKFAVVTHRPLVQEDIEKRFGKDVEVDIETEYGVSYTEFIALNTHMIQKTRRELTKVKQEKADLEVRLQAIEAKLGL